MVEILEKLSDIVKDQYIGFKYRLEENLGIGDDGKALRLYQRTRESKNYGICSSMGKSGNRKIKALPMEADSVLNEKKVSAEASL